MSRQQNILLTSYTKGYRVDNDGLVYGPRGKSLSLKLNSRGYLYFGMKHHSCNYVVSCPVHRLQAYQKFNSLMFNEGIVVRHLDGNRLNNSFDNIAIGTECDNRLDIPKHLRVLYSSHPKHNHEDIILDRLNGLTYKGIMLKYNISSKGTISFIINKSLALTNNIYL